MNSQSANAIPELQQLGRYRGHVIALNLDPASFAEPPEPQRFLRAVASLANRFGRELEAGGDGHVFFRAALAVDRDADRLRRRRGVALRLELAALAARAGNAAHTFGVGPIPSTSVSADRHNNVLQVRIDEPEPGDYIVRIHGFNITRPPQGFAVAALGDIDPALPRMPSG